MVTIEQIATKILEDDPLEVRSLVQDYQRQAPALAEEACPVGTSAQVLVVAAGFAEVIALRTGQDAPGSTAKVGPLDEPLYLVKAALRSRKMRQRIQRESPEPLRARNVYAPPGYLEMA